MLVLHRSVSAAHAPELDGGRGELAGGDILLVGGGKVAGRYAKPAGSPFWRGRALGSRIGGRRECWGHDMPW